MKIIYDSRCPICIKNKLLVQNYDKHKISTFIDIHNSSELNNCMKSFPSINFDKLNSQIYVIKENHIIGGMDAIRIIYHTIGFHKLVNLSKLPILKFFFDVLYKFVSKNRFIISRFLNIK